MALTADAEGDARHECSDEPAFAQARRDEERAQGDGEDEEFLRAVRGGSAVDGLDEQVAPVPPMTMPMTAASRSSAMASNTGLLPLKSPKLAMPMATATTGAALDVEDAPDTRRYRRAGQLVAWGYGIGVLLDDLIGLPKRDTSRFGWRTPPQIPRNSGQPRVRSSGRRWSRIN